MPQARIVTVRETIDVVAPWYSQEREPENQQQKFLTLQRVTKPVLDDAGKETGDTTEEWVETLEAARYKEHITLFRRLSHGDAKWISRQGNMFKGFSANNPNPKIDEAAMGRLRTMGYIRRVVEITNAAGELQPHAGESDFDRFDEPEMQYIDAAIKVLDDPIAPILHEDIEAGQTAAAKIARIEAGGGTVPADQQVNPEKYAAAQAQEGLFRGDIGDLPEPVQSA